MARDWLQLGSPRVMAESIIRECIRLVKLEARNDPDFVPRSNNASFILAGRTHVLLPDEFRPGPDDRDALFAHRVFGHQATEIGTPLNEPNTLVERDEEGGFAAGLVTVEGIIGTDVGGTYDLTLYGPDGVLASLAELDGTQNWEIPNGSLRVENGFGCNGQPTQLAVASGGAAGTTGASGTNVGGSAGATYTATERALINTLVAAVSANASAIDTLAADLNALIAKHNTIRSALVANGILT